MILVFGVGVPPGERSPREITLQFLIALFLFVVVVGLVDLRIKWPTARREKN